VTDASAVQVPPVVAVVVTRDPGPWLEETLTALGAQDYPDLSVLVLDAASAEDPTPRVAAVLPDAFVRRLDHDGGFGANANHAIDMVHGAPLLLFCHDDVAPDPDAVHLLVEEAYRSNAGVVTPKQVGWADTSRLLHVGMAVDKTGAVVDRVLPLELDHGQHDAVRDVFVAPGGCTLVRADLYAELGGFDPLVVGMGEDLDLCWRAQVAGARVVVAPAARVRHLELVAGGLRPLPVADGPAPTLQELQRRHELYAMLKAYEGPHLARVLPQAVVLAAAEVVVALLTGHRQRAEAVVRAWRWNLRHLGAVRAGRAQVAACRRVPDGDVRRLQVRGSARLQSYVRRATTYGIHLAHLDTEAMVASAAGTGALPAVGAPPASSGPSSPPVAEPGTGGEDGGDGPMPDDVGGDLAGAAPPATAGGAGRGAWPSRLFGVVSLAKAEVPHLREPAVSTDEAGRRGAEANRGLQLRATAWLAMVVVGLYGSRSLLSSTFPVVGQFLPMPSWAALWHQAWAGWHPAAGVGATAAASPGLALLGLLATIAFGAVGLVRTVVVLGCLPLGVIGVARLTRPWGSPRAKLVAAVVYLALPLAANDLATGNWQALVVYAAVPWILGILSRAGRLEPEPGRHGTTADVGPVADRRWPSGPARQVLALGLLDAVAASVAPEVLAVTVLVASGLAVGSLAVGGWGAPRTAARLVGVAVGGVVTSFVLLFPWSVSVLSSGLRWQVLFGPRPVAAAGPGVGALLRLAVGPVGHTPLAYGFAVVGALPLLVAGRWRLAWATRLWMLALLGWVVAWLTGRGWTGSLSLPLPVVLAPVGLALALGAGIAVVAFEADLPRHRFGWRQLTPALGGVAVLACLLPSLGAVGSGRWDLPAQGWEQATAFMARRQAPGQFRVLWLGTPSLLPGPSWEAGTGVWASVSQGPVPTLADELTVPDPGPLAAVPVALRQAEHGDTVQLGRVLAPYAIRYVVVTQALAPTVLGYSSPLPSTAPAGLGDILARQLDLRELSTESGYLIFEDPLSPAVRAVDPAGTGVRAPSAWLPVLPGAPGADAYRGAVPAGTLQVADAPGATWEAIGPDGRPLARVASASIGAAFEVPRREPVQLRFRGSWLQGLASLVELFLALGAVALLVGRRRSVDWWWLPLRRRLARRGRHAGVAHRPASAPEQAAGDVRAAPGALP